MKFLFLFLLFSLSSFAKESLCKITYHSNDKTDWKTMRMAMIHVDKIEDIRLDECVAQAEANLGQYFTSGTILRPSVPRLATHADFEYTTKEFRSRGSLGPKEKEGHL